MVSVIIPVYNRENTIFRSIQSVLNQTYKDIEIIVIDDGSKDQTIQIVENINDKRIKIYKNKKNMGACYSRNKGIDLASGDFIAFQDSDDEWNPQKIELQLKAIEKYNADVSFVNILRICDNTKTLFPRLEEGLVKRSKLLEKSQVSTQGILAKSTAFKDIRFDENVQRMQDWDWVIRASGKYNFVFCSDVLVNQYIQSDSISIKKQNWNSGKYLFDKYPTLVSEYPKFRSNLLYNMALYDLNNGYVDKEKFKEIYNYDRTLKNYIKYILALINLNKLLKQILIDRYYK